MSSENNDWVDEIVEAERGLAADELTDSGREKFLNRYDDLEEVWDDVSNRDHEDSSFRIPVEEDNPLNCLGRALMVGMYDELSEGVSDSHVNIYFDGKWGEDGTKTMKHPHVTTTINGEEYGLSGSNKDAELSTESLSDLYKVGIGVKILDEGIAIDGLDYEELCDWGEEIELKYSGEGEETYADGELEEPEQYRGLESEYMKTQGVLMQQDAEKASMEDSIGGDDVYIA